MKKLILRSPRKLITGTIACGVICLCLYLLHPLQSFVSSWHVNAQTGHLDINASSETSTVTINGNIQSVRFVDSSSDSYYIDPGATDKSVIVAGKVGLGTVAPAEMLDIDGTVTSMNYMTSAGNALQMTTPESILNNSVSSLEGALGMDVLNWTFSEKGTFETTADVISATPLLNNNVFIAYQDTGNSNFGTFAIISDTGTTVKSPTVFESTASYQIATTTLPNGNVLIAYKDTGLGTYTIYDSAGNMIISPTTFETGSTTYISTTSLPNGNVFIVYQDTGNNSYGTFVILDSAGNLVKSPTVFESATTSYTCTTALPNGNVFIGYTDEGNSSYGTFVIYDSAGNEVKSATVFNSGSTSLKSCKALTNGNVMIAYRDAGASNYGNFIIYDMHGAAVSSETTFNAAATNYPNVVPLINGDALIIYKDAGGGFDYGTYVIYSNTGSQIVGETAFTSSHTNEESAVRLSTGGVFIAYQDVDESNRGDFVIGMGTGILLSQNLDIYGSLAIGTSIDTSYTLRVNGSLYSSGSSREYKEHIEDLTVDTDKLYDLRPVSFDYKPEYQKLGKVLGGGKQIGLIAEEVYPVIPELTLSDGSGAVTNVDYEKLSVLLLKEIQNRHHILENIDALQQENSLRMMEIRQLVR